MKRRDLLKFGTLTGVAAFSGVGGYNLGRSSNTDIAEENLKEYQTAKLEPYPIEEVSVGDQGRRPAAIDVNGRRIRKSIATPEGQADLAIYEQAVALMKAQPEQMSVGGILVPNGRNWTVQVNAHADHCTHDTWRFFPWHREYLNRFELIVRAITGRNDFAIPYWNWTESPGLPARFRDPSSPLYVTSVLRNSAETREEIRTATRRAIVSPAVINADFLSFLGDAATSGILEASAHNDVHSSIGKPMSTLISPEDPIFWVHHANVDRLWADWQDRHPEYRALTPEMSLYSEWLNLTHGSFYNADGTPRTQPVRTRALLDTFNMGYQYDSSLRPQAPLTGSLPSKAPGKVAGIETIILGPDASAQEADPSQQRIRKMRRPKTVHAEKVRAKSRSSKWSGDSLIVYSELSEKLSGQIERFLKSSLEDADLTFRLRVRGLPIMMGVSSEISFCHRKEPVYSGDSFLLTSHCIFMPPSAHASAMDGKHAKHGHSHHGASGNLELAAPFFVNFQPALLNLKQIGVRRVQGEISFLLEFKDVTQGGVISVKRHDFSGLDFEIEAVELS